MKDEIPYPHSATSVFVIRVKKGLIEDFFIPHPLSFSLACQPLEPTGLLSSGCISIGNIVRSRGDLTNRPARFLEYGPARVK